MKVVMVNNLYAPRILGGAERSVQLLAEAVVASGVDVTVVTAAERACLPVELNGVKVVTVALPNLYWPFDDTRPSAIQRKLWHLVDIYNPVTKAVLRRVIDGERADIVHTNNLQGFSVAAWRAAEAADVPVLHTLRDYYLTCARALRFRDGRNCSRTCSTCVPFCAARRSMSQGVATVVGTSRFILDHHLAQGFFRGAALRLAIANPGDDRIVAKKPGEPALTFGYLGRLEQMKGVELLLRAFETRTDTRWRLLIAGTGPATMVETWRQRAARAKQPDHIRFVGWTDTLDFLARIDALIVPSLWHEPLSRSVIEAQSGGIAVIASRRGGLAEVVEDGMTGLLFEPDDASDLPRAIDRVLEDAQLVRRLGARARERSQRFRPEIVASKYIQAYRETMGSKP